MRKDFPQIAPASDVNLGSNPQGRVAQSGLKPSEEGSDI